MTRVAFLGTPECAVPTLRMVADVLSVAGIFCNPDKPAGRGRKLESPAVKRTAEEMGLPVHQPGAWKLPETRSLWESLRIDLAFVVAYGHILPSWMLDSCRLGVWNLHFSLLPRWRGASPVNHAILAGDAETGVSLMRLTPGLDAGPILSQTCRGIGLEDDAPGLLALLSKDATGLLQEHLPSILAGNANPVPQREDLATYAPKLDREMRLLDFGRSALELHRSVRALQPWPGVELLVEGVPIKVIGVGGLRTFSEGPGTLRWDREGVWLVAGDGQALELARLQRPGKPAQPALQALQPWGPAGVRQLAAGS